MLAVISAVAGAAVGALLTLLVKQRLDRDVENRAARRDLYVELVGLLTAARRILQDSSFAVDERVPDVAPQDRLDALDARLMIDASPEVRDLAEPCFRLLHRFHASHASGAPVELDDDGLSRYRYELVRGQPDEVRKRNMRVALVGISDGYRNALDSLVERIRQEVHGRAATQKLGRRST